MVMPDMEVLALEGTSTEQPGQNESKGEPDAFDQAASKALEGQESVETPAKPEKTPDAPATDEPPTDWSKVDPNKLPPELAGHYKNMQAAFTRSQQALRESLDGLSSHKDRLALIDKAIQGDPEARSHLARIAGVQIPGQPTAEEDPYKDVPEQFRTTKDLVKWLDTRIKAISQAVIPEHIKPLRSQIEEQRVKESYSRAERDIVGMRKAYDDFDAISPHIIEVRKQYPNISLEDSYWLAKAKTTPPKVPVSVTTPKPSAPRPAAVKETVADDGSWEAAYAKAKKQL